jgi:hypothetical protein
MPAVLRFPRICQGGRLMNYGIDLADQYPQNGVCVARDLKGQPAYLPVSSRSCRDPTFDICDRDCHLGVRSRK